MAHRGTRGTTESFARPAPATAMTREVLMAKAAVAAGDAIDETSALAVIDATAREWADQGAVDAPYDPATLLRFVEMCPHLGPNLDGYTQNIDGYGFTAVPAERWMEDLDADDAREAVRAAMAYERWLDAEAAQPDDATEEPTIEEPTDAEAQEVLDTIAARMRRERFRFDAWLANCCSEASFTDLRKRVRWDKEATGWGALEMIRDEAGKLMRLAYVPGFTVRPLVNEGEAVEVVEGNPATVLSEDREVRVWRRFRRYVQIIGSKRVYFKAPGDPRTVSRKTGKLYPDAAAMRQESAEGPDAREAHELIYFAHHWPASPCSPPRWISNLLRVLGCREADETNYFHLKNKTFAGGILFVSGGNLKQGVKDRIEARITQELQGSQNTSRILVVEALPARGAAGERSLLPSITFQSLRDSMTTDAMFVEYDTRASNSIGAAFRQSPLMRGYTPDNLNRATAEAVLRFSEQQVYEPERQTFDHIINKVILPELGIRFLRFKSNSPPARSAEEVGAYVAQVAPHGGITPAQILRLTADVLNLPYEQETAEWTQQPMPLTLAGYQQGGYGGAPPTGAPGAEGEGAEGAVPPVEMAKRIRRVEEHVARIVSEEMRRAGNDCDILARVLDLPGGPP